MSFSFGVRISLFTRLRRALSAGTGPVHGSPLWKDPGTRDESAENLDLDRARQRLSKVISHKRQLRSLLMRPNKASVSS